MADIALLVLVAGLAVFGFFKCFRKSLVSFLGFIISLAIAVFFARATAKALLGLDTIGGWVAGPSGSLFSWLKGILPESLDNVSIESMRSASAGGTDAVKALLETESGSWFTSFMVKLCYPMLESAATNSVYLSAAAGTARDIFALELAFGIFTFITGVLLFITIRIIAAVIGIIISKKGQTKSLLGRFAGTAIGAAKGFLYAVIILSLITLLSGFSFMSKVNENINNSAFVKHVAGVSVKINELVLKGKEDDSRYGRLLELAGLDIAEPS